MLRYIIAKDFEVLTLLSMKKFDKIHFSAT